MGNALKPKSCKHKLTNYDTGTLWHFTKSHAKELTKYINVDIIIIIIKLYIGINNDYRYKTYIHLNISPLNNNYKGIPSDWLNFVESSERSKYRTMILFGYKGVGKSLLCHQFIFGDNNNNNNNDDDFYRYKYSLNVNKKYYDKHESEILNNNNNDNNTKQMITIDIQEHNENNDYILSETIIEFGSIFLLIFDVMDNKSFDYIKKIGNKISKIKRNKDYVIIIVGNKCDLKNVNDGNLNDNINEWIKENEFVYIETSAKKSKNVHLLFRQSIYEYWLKTINFGKDSNKQSKKYLDIDDYNKYKRVIKFKTPFPTQQI